MATPVIATGTPFALILGRPRRAAPTRPPRQGRPYKAAPTRRLMSKSAFDVIVIGAGHAGCEAAHIAARVAARTALVTIDINSIGQMSCNPAIGGIPKAPPVRPAHSLGGNMGQVLDSTRIHLLLPNP